MIVFAKTRSTWVEGHLPGGEDTGSARSADSADSADSGGAGAGGCGGPVADSIGGMAAVTELVERLDVVAAVDAAVGPIKTRDRGQGAGQLLVGIAAAQLAGEEFLVGLDRQRADVAGQALA